MVECLKLLQGDNEKIRSSSKTFFLWILSSAIVHLFILLILYIAGIIWWPTGIRDPKLTQVAGDSWAITNDGRFFYKESGDWENLNIETSVPAVWGTGFDDNLVIATKNEVHYRHFSLEQPVLREPIVATGEIDICMPDSNVSRSYTFASSPSEIAISYWVNEPSWVVIPLKNRLSVPVVNAGCNLYYAAGKTLNVIKVEMPDDYAYNSISLTEIQRVSSYGEITSITSSHESVWVMTTSNKVLQFEWYEYDPSSWDILPSPPVLKNSYLVAGTLGYTFGAGGIKHVDLWLMGDDGVYWYDREKQNWDTFKIYGMKPVALSGLTSSSETVGYSISRLAIVNGVLLQQYPLEATRGLWKILSIPVSGFLGLLMLFFCDNYKRQHVIDG